MSEDVHDEIIEDLEEVAPWGWGWGTRHREYHAKDAFIHPTWGGWNCYAYSCYHEVQNTPVEALQAALDWRADELVRMIGELPVRDQRIVRARAALGDLGAMLQRDGEDVAADLIRGTLSDAGVAICWEKTACTLCGGRRWLTEDVNKRARMIYLWPCPMEGCAEKGAVPTIVSRNRGQSHQLACALRPRGGDVRITEEDSRWCPELDHDPCKTCGGNGNILNHNDGYARCRDCDGTGVRFNQPQQEVTDHDDP